MAKSKKSEDRDERGAVREAIAAAPTASDAQIAAAAEVSRDLVTEVRGAMGAKHTWPAKRKD